MARLRIRIELNRGGVGVPLHKLASVVDESQKFFRMLAEDVSIGKGEWLGFDFDHESLNFTAEYVGHVTAEQVQGFYAAFDGTTSLRRATISQFARITEAIGEDELIGFGIYQGDEGAEPSDWRCLSRRDALRITDEIQLLAAAEAEGEMGRESHLPAVVDSGMGARLFGDRRERAVEQTKALELAREMESALSRRITRVENKLDEHDGIIGDLRSDSAATEQSFRNLLTAVEGFCDQATKQIERVAPLALPAPAPANPLARMNINMNWTAAAIAAIIVIGILVLSVQFWNRPSTQHFEQKVAAASPAPPVMTPAPAPVVTPPAPVFTPAPPPSPARRSKTMRVELEASEPTWTSITDADGNKVMVRLLVPGEPKTFDLEKSATLRTGNAGGLSIRLDGKPIGSIGPRGKVREVEFKDGAFKLSPSE